MPDKKSRQPIKLHKGSQNDYDSTYAYDVGNLTDVLHTYKDGLNS